MQQRAWKTLTFTGLVLLAVLARATVAHGVTIRVPSEQPTIQAGLNVANGDTVLVAAGIYTGPGNRDLDFRGYDVLLRSEAGAASTIIDAGGSEGDPHRAFDFDSGEGNGAIVEGFQITGGYVTSPHPEDMGAGMICENGSSPTVLDCIFTGNSAYGTGGGLACTESSPVLRRCVFELNEVRHPSGDGGGIFCWESTLVVEDCTFVQNRADEGAGMCVVTNSSAVLRRCVFAGNEATNPVEAGAGIVVVNASTLIENCTFVGNITSFAGYTVAFAASTGYFQRNIIAHAAGSGLLCSPGTYADCNDVWNSANHDYAGCNPAPSNLSADPEFCHFPTLDLTLSQSSPCVPGNSPAGCGLIGAFDVGCGPVAVESTTWGAIKAHYR